MLENKKIGVGFGVMILKNNKLLLGKRHDDPEKASSLLNGAGKWSMPGGKLDFGESFEQGAKRELKEETNLNISESDLELIAINNDIVETAHFVTIGLLCKNFSGDLKIMEPDEITEWRWFDLDNLPKPLYFPSEKIINNYLLNKTYLRK